MKWLIKYFDHGSGLGGSSQYHNDRNPLPLTQIVETDNIWDWWEKYIESETKKRRKSYDDFSKSGGVPYDMFPMMGIFTLVDIVKLQA